MAVFGTRRERGGEPAGTDPASAGTVGEELLLWSDDSGVLVAGADEAVAALARRLESSGGTVVPVPTSDAAGAAAVFASGFADGATSAQFVQFTDHSRALIQEQGVIPTGGGAFQAVVRGDDHRFVGNLQWRAADLGAQRALVFQTAAIGLALRLAIRDVEVAVERVAERVEAMAVLLRAERLGEVLGDRRTLEEMAERARQEGLSQADWMSVAALGPAITRDVEKLRAHVRLSASEASAGRPRARAAAAERLLRNDQLPEVLALLVVAEHNLALWHEVKLHHLQEHEADFVASGVRQARELVQEHRAVDQELLDATSRVRADLLEPTVYDGLAPLQSRRMHAAAREFDELLRWFAEQRRLDLDRVDLGERPSLADSLRTLRGQGVEAMKSASTATRDAAHVRVARLRAGRSRSDRVAELESVGDRPALLEGEGEAVVADEN